LASYDFTGFNAAGVAYDGNNLWVSSYKYAKTIYKTDIKPIPEPSTMLLLGSGLIGMVLYRRKQELKQV